MFELLITILICWLLLRWLCPRTTTPIYIEPPPQIVIHVHNANVLIQPPPREVQSK